ncbi:hypothetical protein Ancab_040537 [Ancistrocladus abbreviatus]
MCIHHQVLQQNPHESCSEFGEVEDKFKVYSLGFNPGRANFPGEVIVLWTSMAFLSNSNPVPVPLQQCPAQVKNTCRFPYSSKEHRQSLLNPLIKQLRGQNNFRPIQHSNKHSGFKTEIRSLHLLLSVQLKCLYMILGSVNKAL